MRTILLSLLIFTAAVFVSPVARAQEDPTQQQIDKLSGEIQDLRDAMGAQDKRLAALETKINDLTDKINSSGSGGVASADDLKKLADVVQEVDKKRQADNEAVLKELDKLDKALGVTGSSRKSTATTSATTGSSTPAGGAQKGYYYEIKTGDNLTAISKAYREQGVKVTAEQIQAANPGLNPRNMVVGKKIFIPDPNAK
jgi:septal ring factor EnvC (AmiA/AmiB activator)